MKREDFRRFLDAVFAATDAEEMACSECLEEIPRYADVEAAGREAAELMPGVAHHLRECAECAEVYRAIREFVGKDQL